jgi:hypothetical protein
MNIIISKNIKLTSNCKQLSDMWLSLRQLNIHPFCLGFFFFFTFSFSCKLKPLIQNAGLQSYLITNT